MDTVDVDVPVLAVTFTLTLADFVRGFLFHFGRIIRWFCGIIGGLGIAMLLTALSPPDGSPPLSVIPSLEFIGMAALFPLVIVLASVIQFLGRRAQANTMAWSWFPDRIECTTATSSGTMQWSGFVRVRESRSAFLFYPQRGAFSLVPKHALGAAGIETIRRLVVEKLGRHAIVRRDITPGQRAWSRTLWGFGYGFVLWLLAIVIQSRHDTFIPAAVSSAPVGLLAMPLALLAAPFTWPVLAGFAGSQRWRRLGLGLLSIHSATAIWFVTGSSIADWDLFHSAMEAAPIGVTTWAALYLIGLGVVWVTVLRRR